MKHISVFPDNASFDAVKSKLTKPYVALVKSNDIVFYSAEQSSAPVSVTVVDLGLPSGTKWMSMNLNATSPEDVGDLCAFGALKGVKINTANYNGLMNINFLADSEYWANENPIVNPTYTDMLSDNMYHPYCAPFDGSYELDSNFNYNLCLDENGCLLPEYDVITHTYGDKYCLPTNEQLDELMYIMYDIQYNEDTYEENGSYADLYDISINHGYSYSASGVPGSSGIDIYTIKSKSTGETLVIPACSDTHQGYAHTYATIGYWSKNVIPMWDGSYDTYSGYPGFSLNCLNEMTDGLYIVYLLPIRGVEKQ